MTAYAATAQTFMDNVRAEIQTKIQHLNQNDVPTRILYDMYGQKKTSNRALGNNPLTLNISNIPNGIYILKIIGQNGVEATKHISIER
nr:T9SS type A sorting domain-containing protein [Aequorivita sp. S2608]